MSNGERVTKPQDSPKQREADDRARTVEASNLLGAASDVLQNRRGTMIKNQPAVDLAALWMLLAAATGERDGKTVSGQERRALLTAALATLRPAMSRYAQDPDQKDWLHANVEVQLDGVERAVEFDEANDRVRGAMLLPGNKVVDPGDDLHPREQAEALHDAVPKLVAALKMLDEAIVGLHEESLDKAIEKVLEGESASGVRVGSLVELGNVLSTVNGFLLLTDDELRQRLHEINGVVSGVQTIGELVKGTLLLVGGTLGVVTSGVGLVARAVNEPEIAQLCSSFSQQTGLKVGRAIAAIELATSIATLVSGRATRQQKIDAGVSLATASASLFAKAETSFHGIGALPAATAVQLGYSELKLTLQLYWGAAEGLVGGLMGPAFETLAERGRMIAGFGEQLVKAQALLDAETDVAKKDALARVVAVNAQQAGSEIDALISDLAPPDLEAGMARSPGAYQILVEAMRPVFAFRGVRAPEPVMIAASIALARLAWVANHRAQIVEAAASHHGLDAVKESKQKEDSHGRE